jgi:hypothetical protein
MGVFKMNTVFEHHVALTHSFVQYIYHSSSHVLATYGYCNMLPTLLNIFFLVCQIYIWHVNVTFPN